MKSIFLWCCCAVFLLAATSRAQGLPIVRVTQDAIEIEFDKTEVDQQLVSLGLYEADDAAGLLDMIVPAGTTRLSLDRIAPDGSDRLYRRFVLRQDGVNAFDPQFVTDTSALATNDSDLTWPKGIKGVSCPVDVSDLVELGIEHIHTNVSISKAFLPEGTQAADEAFRVEHDGYTFHFNKSFWVATDREIQELTAANINVVTVMLNPFVKDAGLTELLTHPEADESGYYSAYRIDNPESVARFAAFFEFFADRYTKPGFPHGKVGGIIVGNEVDSHWTWHNMGRTDVDTVAEHYGRELRLVQLAVRSAHAELPIFASLTHSWTWPNSLDLERNVAGKELFDKLMSIGKAGGDFNWHLAYHPYPSNLFKPAFWNDRIAVFGHDTPQITFKNVEVLGDYLNQPAQQYEGKTRRIIFSEQGLDAGKTAESEELQAAALALAWRKIEAMESVDAFILHRHLDHPKEGGLRLGLLKLDSNDETKMMDKSLWSRRPAWHLFQAAGTEDFNKAALPYLAQIGRENLLKARAPTYIPESAPVDMGKKRSEDVVVSLPTVAGKATVQNHLAWGRRMSDLPDGGVRESILLHPTQSDEPAEATFELTLPQANKLTLLLTTGKQAAGGDGYTVEILANGQSLLTHNQPDQAMVDHVIDLSSMVGQSLTLVFRVSKNANERYDGALMIDPRIIRGEGGGQ